MVEPQNECMQINVSLELTAFFFFLLTRYKGEVHQLCAATNCMSKKYGTVLMESGWVK